MIVGTGVDVIEIDRIKAAHQRWGGRFLRRVFTETEVRYCLKKKNPYPSLAARFAAKESGFKALSQAGVHIILWRSIWVERDRWGRPTLHTAPETSFRLHLALTHSKEYAVATVVVEAEVVETGAPEVD